MINIKPKTIFGRLSVALAILTPILFFIGSSLTSTLYESVSAGDTIIKDIIDRPVLAITMLVANLLGITAFILGIISIIKQKENSPIVFISTIAGFLLLLLIIGEIFFPH